MNYAAVLLALSLNVPAFAKGVDWHSASPMMSTTKSQTPQMQSIGHGYDEWHDDGFESEYRSWMVVTAAHTAPLIAFEVLESPPGWDITWATPKRVNFTTEQDLYLEGQTIWLKPGDFDTGIFEARFRLRLFYANGGSLDVATPMLQAGTIFH